MGLFPRLVVLYNYNITIVDVVHLTDHCLVDVVNTNLLVIVDVKHSEYQRSLDILV